MKLQFSVVSLIVGERRVFFPRSPNARDLGIPQLVLRVRSCSRGELMPRTLLLDTEHFYDDALGALAVEFGVKDALPGAEV